MDAPLRCAKFWSSAFVCASEKKTHMTRTPSHFVDKGHIVKRQALRTLVQTNLINGTIELVHDTSAPGYYSRLFLVPKTSGGWRPVIDLSSLNAFLELPHFTMETAESIRRSLPRDAWVTSIDLVDAYFHIPIHRGYRKFRRFQTRDATYQFKALPFGLSPAPWVFTKVMMEVKVLVHGMGINLCQYLDDWLIYSTSRDQCLRDTGQVLQLCHTMGLLIHETKSDLIPTQKFIFLGYQFDLTSFQVTPTLERYHKIVDLIRSILLKQGGAGPYMADAARSVCCHRETSSSRSPAYTRNPALFLPTLGFQSVVERPVDPTGPSCRGGPHMVDVGEQYSEGFSGYPQGPGHSVVYRRIEHRLGSTLGHVDSIRGLVPERENTRVESYITSHAPLAEATQKPHSPCCNGQFTCSVLHQQAGRDTVNVTVQTDQTTTAYVSARGYSIAGSSHSQEFFPTQMSGTEWSLHLSVFQAITQEWGIPTLDLFATRWNHKLPLFVSPVPDPLAMAVDALSMSWKAMWAYAYPPPAPLPLILQKVQRDQCQCQILIAPCWIQTVWFPLFLGMLIDSPLQIPNIPQLLSQPRGLSIATLPISSYTRGEYPGCPLQQRLFDWSCLPRL